MGSTFDECSRLSYPLSPTLTRFCIREVFSQYSANQSVFVSFSFRNNKCSVWSGSQELFWQWIFSWTRRSRTCAGNGNCFITAVGKNSTSCSTFWWKDETSFMIAVEGKLNIISSERVFPWIWTFHWGFFSNVWHHHTSWQPIRPSWHRTLNNDKKWYQTS